MNTCRGAASALEEPLPFRKTGTEACNWNVYQNLSQVFDPLTLDPSPTVGRGQKEGLETHAQRVSQYFGRVLEALSIPFPRGGRIRGRF